MLSLRTTPQGVIFKIFVLPRSSKNMVAGFYDDAVKIKLTAPPVDGSANKLCLKFLSKILKTPKSSLEIVSGQTSRKKQILFHYQSGKSPDSEYKRIRHLIHALVG